MSPARKTLLALAAVALAEAAVLAWMVIDRITLLRSGREIVYPLTDEEWGVRRFFVRDPGGVVVNVMSHIDR